MKKIFIVIVFLLFNVIIWGQTPVGNTKYEKLKTF